MQRFVRPATSLYRQLGKRFPELPCLFFSLEKAHEEHHDLELTPDDVPHVPGLCALDRSSPTAHSEAEHRKGAKRLAGSAAQRQVMASTEAAETLVRAEPARTSRGSQKEPVLAVLFRPTEIGFVIRVVRIDE